MLKFNNKSILSFKLFKEEFGYSGVLQSSVSLIPKQLCSAFLTKNETSYWLVSFEFIGKEKRIAQKSGPLLYFYDFICTKVVSL